MIASAILRFQIGSALKSFKFDKSMTNSRQIRRFASEPNPIPGRCLAWLEPLKNSTNTGIRDFSRKRHGMAKVVVKTIIVV